MDRPTLPAALPAPLPSRMLSAREVARLLGISVRRVWTWRASGALPAPHRFNARVVRWSAEDLSAWLASRKVPA